MVPNENGPTELPDDEKAIPPEIFAPIFKAIVRLGEGRHRSDIPFDTIPQFELSVVITALENYCKTGAMGLSLVSIGEVQETETEDYCHLQLIYMVAQQAFILNEKRLQGTNSGVYRRRLEDIARMSLFFHNDFVSRFGVYNDLLRDGIIDKPICDKLTLEEVGNLFDRSRVVACVVISFLYDIKPKKPGPQKAPKFSTTAIIQESDLASQVALQVTRLMLETSASLSDAIREVLTRPFLEKQDVDLASLRRNVIRKLGGK